MCGIVAYAGSDDAVRRVLTGLSHVEYRGYDSAGVAYNNGQKIVISKTIGGVEQLESLIDSRAVSSVAIGHTRWATHGPATFENAHPHVSFDDSLALVHNGIVENISSIRQRLLAHGIHLVSQTDSECIAHLIALSLKATTLKESLQSCINDCIGAFSVCVQLKEQPETIAFIRVGSPLLIGKSRDGMMIASDQTAFDDSVEEVAVIPNMTYGAITADTVIAYDQDGAVRSLYFEPRAQLNSQVSKEGYDHYMLKEINEQYDSLFRTVESFYVQTESGAFWDGLGIEKSAIQHASRIHIVAAGTSYHAGLIGRYYIEEFLNIPVTVHVASEFRYQKLFIDDQAIYLFISQSGETADTLECLRLIHEKSSAHTIALSNVSTSSLVREARGYMCMQAGPEVAVASTKAFTAQLASLYWLCAVSAANDETHIAIARGDIRDAAKGLHDVLSDSDEVVRQLVNEFDGVEHMLFLGRHIMYPVACEAALKLKELSYIFSHAYPAGELKHGPLALIGSHTPVMVFSSSNDLLYSKLLVNVQEVKARHGNVIAVCLAHQRELQELADVVIIVPAVSPLLQPIVMSAVLQLFAYKVTVSRNLSVDKPRNLAKSVTVE